MLRALAQLVATTGVVVEDPAVVAQALEAARTGTAGFADLLISQVAFAHGAREIITFDKSFGRLSRVCRLA